MDKDAVEAIRVITGADIVMTPELEVVLNHFLQNLPGESEAQFKNGLFIKSSRGGYANKTLYLCKHSGQTQIKIKRGQRITTKEHTEPVVQYIEVLARVSNYTVTIPKLNKSINNKPSNVQYHNEISMVKSFLRMKLDRNEWHDYEDEMSCQPLYVDNIMDKET